VLSCGGTHWKSQTQKLREVVWSEKLRDYVVQSGGGVSQIFKEPHWQSMAGVKTKTGKRGRGVPDVSGKADIERGYCMRVAGLNITMGGTSAAAPMWAGLIARINQKLEYRVGFFTPLLYRKIFYEALNDIIKGRNGAHYKAGPGWDPCTGWGTPNGNKLLTALRSS
jgi:kumamolisin